MNQQKRERWPFPSCFIMNQEQQIVVIQQLIAPLLTDDIFLVNIKIKPVNNIKVYVDADSGLSIEKCVKINRALYKIIEEKELYPDGNFSLEVSSPGIDEPLRLLRQYKKNVGREVELHLQDETILKGILTAVIDTPEEQVIRLEISEGKGKKTTKKEVATNFSNIVNTKVQIKF